MSPLDLGTVRESVGPFGGFHHALHFVRHDREAAACIAGRTEGPLLRKRTVWEGRRRARTVDSLEALRREFEERLAPIGKLSLPPEPSHWPDVEQIAFHRDHIFDRDDPWMRSTA